MELETDDPRAIGYHRSCIYRLLRAATRPLTPRLDFFAALSLDGSIVRCFALLVLTRGVRRSMSSVRSRHSETLFLPRGSKTHPTARDILPPARRARKFGFEIPW